MQAEDPWAAIERPAQSGVNALRVSSTHRWPFYWARNVDGDAMLVLTHSIPGSDLPAVPALRGIDVQSGENPDGTWYLSHRLTDTTLRDLFRELCLNIVKAAEACDTELAAVHAAIARTWRWHRLLRGGTTGLLGDESQKGLIGELIVLEDHVLHSRSAVDAIDAWRGPLGAPKDFELGDVCIEAKARRGAATPFVAISSSHQLDPTGVEQLYLYVVDLAAAAGDDGYTLTDVAARIRDVLDAADPAASWAFEERLEAAGFDWTHDYSASRWLDGKRRIYRVAGDFPRLTAAGAPAGVRDVRYAVDLHACEQYLVEPEELASALDVGAAA